MNITFHHNYHVEKLKEMMKFEKRISFIFWSPVLLTFSFLPSYVFFLIFSYFIAKNAHYFSENIIKIMNILFLIHPFFNILYDTTVFLCIMIPFLPLLKYLINEVPKNVWGFVIFQCKIRVYLEKKKKIEMVARVHCLVRLTEQKREVERPPSLGEGVRLFRDLEVVSA